MDMNKLATVGSALIFCMVAAAANAHHSAAQFDFQNTVMVSGKVVEARFANPHMRLVLEVTDDKRGTRDIEFEGHSRNNMLRQGLTPDLFGVGDEITIRIAPTRDGSDGGYVVGVRTSDGHEIGRVTQAD
jgi:Family of unknown function (DUF6152)